VADETPKPIDEDVRHDDLEYNPALEPQSSKAWLNLLEESETAFEPWNLECDKIDKSYASLERLANYARDRQFQMFWANMEVLKPSIYAKPPIPVVVPKFKDRRPVYQAASEVMERCAITAFDLAYVNDAMLQIRDDVALIGRGVAWVRYESGRDGGSYHDHEKVCIDFKHRRDFLHSISRCWYEVSWVAAASYLTRAQARARFYKYSGDCYQDAEYRVDKESKEIGGADERERAKFWEIWHKGERRVVWVACGCEDVLDEAEPHLDLPGFFPCPKPAYGTCQRGSLVPVPDSLQYQDQLDEVNRLTGRIHALTEAIVVKGFFPAGGEIGDAVQKAYSIYSSSEVLIPISNWAAFGGSKEILIWLPIDMIAETVTTLVAIRKQIIDDIYQLVGLSDIMRGATDAQETLGAQRLKSQYGSVRVRDKQYALTCIAKDLVQLTCEIIAERFDDVTIVEMSQTQLPTQEAQQQALARLQQQLAQVFQQAQMAGQQQQPAQQGAVPGDDPRQQQLQQFQQQAESIQSQIQQLTEKPTIDQVLNFFKNNRMRSFVLDIETDSTILIDEQAEKEQRGEFMQTLANLLPQLMQMIAAEPKTGEFCGEVLKFAVAPYRAGRSLDGAIDQLVELAKSRSDVPRGDDPTTATNKTALQIEGMKQQTQKDKNQADVALRIQELQLTDKHKTMEIASRQQIEMAKLQGKSGDDAAKMQQTNQKMMSEREKHQMSMIAEQAKMQADARKMQMAEQAAQARQGDLAARQQERQAAQAFKQSQPQGPAGRPGL
jgi:hypothetical protein